MSTHHHSAQVAQHAAHYDKLAAESKKPRPLSEMPPGCAEVSPGIYQETAAHREHYNEPHHHGYTRPDGAWQQQDDPLREAIERVLALPMPVVHVQQIRNALGPEFGGYVPGPGGHVGENGEWIPANPRLVYAVTQLTAAMANITAVLSGA